MYRSIGQCCGRIAPSQYVALTQNAKPTVAAVVSKAKLHTTQIRSNAAPSETKTTLKPIQSSPTQQIRSVSMAKMAAEPFMNGTSSVYIEEMYRAWVENPESVHKV